MMPPQRIWIMENGLRGRDGHHLNNSLGLFRACRERGLEPRFLVGAQAAPEIAAALAARPLFRFSPYDEISPDPLAGPLENLFLQGRAFAEGFDAAIAEGMTGDDLVFVPTTLQNELYGCAVGLARLPAERRPRLVLNFMIENFLAPGRLELGWNACLYRFALRELQRLVTAERVLLTANGSRMADWSGRALGYPVADYPMPKHYPFPPADAAAAFPSPLRVAILGHSLPAKGFALVPALVARHPGLQWLVQVAPDGQEALWEGGLDAVMTAPNVELCRGSLEPEAYYALLARSDIVLLPYDPLQLPLRSSGVFAEAVATGKVVVAPRDSSMGVHLAAGRGAGATFAPWNVDTISTALARAADEFPRLAAYAGTVATAWRDSQSIGAFLDRALAEFAAREGRGPAPEAA